MTENYTYPELTPDMAWGAGVAISFLVLYILALHLTSA
jgi:hypothetical protein